MILPRRNEGDLDELPKEIRRDVEFVLVDSADEVLRTALTPA